MPVRFLAGVIVLAFAPPALGQSPPIQIRVIGEHAAITGDTPELARQLALVDAQRKAWQAAVAQLQGRADVKALQLTPVQLEAYIAVILETEEAPTRSAGPARTLQVPLGASLDASAAVERMTGLRGDQDASLAIVNTWIQIQQLHQQLADQSRRRSAATNDDSTRSAEEQHQTVRAATVKHLAARAAAALARTELATIGGRTVTESGRERARQLADVARALDPDSPDVHSLMGDLLVDAEQPEAAEAEYRQALAGNATSNPARIKLAEVLRLQGKFGEAITELSEAIRLDPKSAGAHTDLGLILRAEGDLDQSVAEYREAIRLDPDWFDAHNGLAVAYANQKRLDLAVEEFRELTRIDPDTTIGYYNLAIVLADLDRDVESAAALREVIRIYPNHYNARYNLGELFRLEGKFDESAKQFREYVRLAPDTPQNQRNLRRARQFIEQFAD
jgi:tetratricopeptide (TPR) repeat protein